MTQPLGHLALHLSKEFLILRSLDKPDLLPVQIELLQTQFLQLSPESFEQHGVLGPNFVCLLVVVDVVLS